MPFPSREKHPNQHLLSWPKSGETMPTLNNNDALAGALFLLALFSFIVCWFYQRRKKHSSQRSPQAALAAEAFLHAAAEEGSHLSFYLGSRFAWPYPDLSGASGLAFYSLASKRAVFNDHANQAAAGDPALALIGQMVTQGHYKNAVALELFRPERTFWSGSSPWAAIAGSFSLTDSPANAALILSGGFGSEILLATEQMARSSLPSLAFPATLSGQTAAFLGSAYLALGEDAFQTTPPMTVAAKASLQAQDIMRILIGLGLIAAAVFKLAGVLQ